VCDFSFHHVLGECNNPGHSSVTYLPLEPEELDCQRLWLDEVREHVSAAPGATQCDWRQAARHWSASGPCGHVWSRSGRYDVPLDELIVGYIPLILLDFLENGLARQGETQVLLIRRSLVRAQVGEPKLQYTSRPCVNAQGLFVCVVQNIGAWNAGQCRPGAVGAQPAGGMVATGQISSAASGCACWGKVNPATEHPLNSVSDAELSNDEPVQMIQFARY
jgi:hypothetical protein